MEGTCSETQSLKLSLVIPEEQYEKGNPRRMIHLLHQTCVTLRNNLDLKGFESDQSRQVEPRKQSKTPRGRRLRKNAGHEVGFEIVSRQV
jgi:hypothetical protein